MNIFVRKILILLSPLVFMILTNEAMRIKIKDGTYSAQGIKPINSAEYLPNKCSWACHNNTVYCKNNHVKYLKQFYVITDVLYFGVIAALASTGNYVALNIIFLVLLFPITILYFIIKSIRIQDEIRKLSK